MNINIPDKIYKFFVLAGVFLAAYSFYQIDKEETKYSKKIERYNDIVDSLTIAIFTRNYELNEIGKKADLLSKRYCVENPIIQKDSTLQFTRKHNGTKQELLVNDSISALWEKHGRYKFKIKLLEKRGELASKHIDSAKTLKDDSTFSYKSLFNSGLLLLSLGLFLWLIDQPWRFLTTKKQKKQFDKIYTYCQSCGKKFSSILKYGSNKNKDKNYSFCEKCFKNGEFKNKVLTKEDVMIDAKEKTKHKNWFYRKLLENRLSKLERWKENEY